MFNSISVSADGLSVNAYFQPPPGGDIVIRSRGNVEFCTHAVILAIASSVFRDMFAIGTGKTNNTVELVEDAQTISIILQFIYPLDRIPQIRDNATLRLCLEAAHKYDLSGMLRNIDDQLVRPECKLCLEPLEMYTLGVEYDLPNARAYAARRLAVDKNLNFLDPTRLVNLVTKAELRRGLTILASIQGLRYKIISETILDLSTPHMREASFRGISCDGCARFADGGVEFHRPPGWLLLWSKEAHKALVVAPLDRCLRYFEAGIFDNFDESPVAGCYDCTREICTSASKRKMFNRWASGLKNTLEENLATLEPLYQLS